MNFFAQMQICSEMQARGRQEKTYARGEARFFIDENGKRRKANVYKSI